MIRNCVSDVASRRKRGLNERSHLQGQAGGSEDVTLTRANKNKCEVLAHLEEHPELPNNEIFQELIMNKVLSMF